MRYPPGSQQAVTMGCSCPAAENCYGRGYLEQSGVYVYRENCPVHTLVEVWEFDWNDLDRLE